MDVNPNAEIWVERIASMRILVGLKYILRDLTMSEMIGDERQRLIYLMPTPTA